MWGIMYNLRNPWLEHCTYMCRKSPETLAEPGMRGFGLCFRSRNSEAPDPLFWSRQRGQFCITPSHVVTDIFLISHAFSIWWNCWVWLWGACVEVFLCFKGSLTRDFLLQFFFTNEFYPGPWVTFWTISYFNEFSRKNSQLCVYRRCYWHQR